VLTLQRSETAPIRNAAIGKHTPCAHADRGHEEAEALGALAEDVLGQQRHEHAGVERAEAHHEEHPQHRADLGRAQG
jgi:hypothetical protein